MKLKNTLRYLMGEEQITHLGSIITIQSSGCPSKAGVRDAVHLLQPNQATFQKTTPTKTDPTVQLT